VRDKAGFAPHSADGRDRELALGKTMDLRELDRRSKTSGAASALKGGVGGPREIVGFAQSWRWGGEGLIVKALDE